MIILFRYMNEFLSTILTDCFNQTVQQDSMFPFFQKKFIDYSWCVNSNDSEVS